MGPDYKQYKNCMRKVQQMWNKCLVLWNAIDMKMEQLGSFVKNVPVCVWKLAQSDKAYLRCKQETQSAHQCSTNQEASHKVAVPVVPVARPVERMWSSAKNKNSGSLSQMMHRTFYPKSRHARKQQHVIHDMTSTTTTKQVWRWTPQPDLTWQNFITPTGHLPSASWKVDSFRSSPKPWG